VLDDRPAVGGGLRTDFPFAAAPRLAASTGAHRLGFVSRDLLRVLGLSLPLRPRDPARFVPTCEPGSFLLAGPGHAAFREAVARCPSAGPREAAALAAMHTELDAMVSDLGPAWLSGPLRIEATADRFLRATLREAFVALCRGSIGDHAARFGLRSDLVKAALAADALSGTFGSWSTAGTGAAMLLRHAAQALEGGADAVPVGGLSALVRVLAEAALAAGVTVAVGQAATRILIEGNTAAGVQLASGEELRAATVVSSADPARLRAMIGDAHLPAEFQRRVEGFARPGAAAKVNLALSGLPRFAALPADQGQHRATIHLVPGVGADAPAALDAAFAEASAGRIPAAPMLEVLLPTASDPQLHDPEQRHHLSALVPWAPYDLAGSTWAAEEERLLGTVLDRLEAFAPGLRQRVVDASVLSPRKLETELGVTRGHLNHVDDALLFGDRLAYTTPIGSLYACGAGCAPAGGAFAIAGHNAAKRVIADLEMGLERTEVGLKR
jgi:phytoene dehydrogenase-like protein